jgi:hypothetical protein
MNRACSTHCSEGNAYRIFVGNPAGKRTLGRLRRRWEDNIKIYLGVTEWDDMNWIHLAQDRNEVMNLRAP